MARTLSFAIMIATFASTSYAGSNSGEVDQSTCAQVCSRRFDSNLSENEKVLLRRCIQQKVSCGGGGRSIRLGPTLFEAPGRDAVKTK